MTGYRLSQREQQLASKEKTDDEVKCKFCGKKGHGSSPNFEIKKEKCSAFDKKVIPVERLVTFRKQKLVDRISPRWKR